MANLRLIGYWRNESNPELPDPVDFVDTDWDQDDRAQIGVYFANGVSAIAMMGYSTCRICGEENGCEEFTDGTYLWPQGLAHYVVTHGVRLPREVEEHAMARLDALETAAVAAHGLSPTSWIKATS